MAKKGAIMLENISSEEIKSQFKSNKKVRLISLVVGGIVLLIVGYFIYRQFVAIPKGQKSEDSYWVGLNYANQDSTDMAIDELSAAVKKYDGYKGGENAQFVLGRQYMEKGDFKKAIETLEDVSTSDTYISAMAVGLQGDCYSEMGKYKEAVEKYVAAADENENDMTTPSYLFKAGLCAEKLQDFEAALTYFQRIKDDFATFGNRKTIDKYIARVSGLKTK